MNITPEKTTLKALFSNEDCHYIVPVYQRDYAWKPDQVRQLWDDVISAWETESEYFMGPFVLNSEEHSVDVFDIVDGQQRLATFSILFSVIKQYVGDFLREAGHPIYQAWSLTEEGRTIAEKTIDISSRRLGWQLQSRNYYLTLNRKDDDFFRQHILGRTIPPRSPEEFVITPNKRMLEKAYLLFCENIKERFVSKSDGLAQLHKFLLHTIQHLWFLKISVSTSSEAYLLFEGLNHKGMSLSVADLLKNKFLMTCGEDEALKETVLKCWEKMSTAIDKSRFDLAEYIRTYWAAFHSLERSPVSKKQLYGTIKSKVTAENVENLVTKLSNLSDFYAEMTSATSVFPSTAYLPNTIEAIFAELNELKYSVCYPLLLATKVKRPSLLLPLARRTLSYLFRVITIEETAVGRAKQAVNAALEALNSDQIDEVILSKLTDLDDTDLAFIYKLKNGQLESNYVARYILCKIHVYQLGHETSIHPDTVHLEHILPVQHFDHWRDFITGEGVEADQWVYNIGNMTLLSKSLNQSIQNKNFATKVEQYRQRCSVNDGGTTIQMTYALHASYQEGATTWTKERIIERAEEFASLATAIWPRG